MNVAILAAIVVLILLNAWVAWQQRRVAESEKPVAKVSHAPVTLQLMDAGQRLRHEVTLHCAEAPTSYAYGGAEYRKLVTLKSGVHVYGPA